MRLDRRTFLQQSGLALLTWGATEAGISFAGKTSRFKTIVNNYQQTLAEPTSRKLALLVGINKYPHQDHLKGCLTDVELQRELLIHRFGFNSQDILILSDRQATRENIETAFIEHLGKQAQANDVVVFHFSGYGRQIKMPLASEAAPGNVPPEAIKVEQTQNTDSLNSTASTPFKLVNSFVPIDGILPANQSSLANNILQDTLLALAQSLSTAKCTFVLDTSFNNTPRSRHSSLKIRSATEIAESSSPQELIFLEQLRSNFAAKGLKPSKRLLSLPGVVLSASSNSQVAAEKQWDGFSAGVFTKALTQHLWQMTPGQKIQVALSKTAASVEQVMGIQQQPTLNNPDKSAIAYYSAIEGALNATGVVSKVNNSHSVELKLLGLPATVLAFYGVHSCLSLISADSAQELDTPQLQIQSQTGLISKAKFLHPESIEQLQPGQLVRENIRMLEPNLGLNLALDKNMQRIERVDATSALANITGVNSTVVSGEQNADCLLGKVEQLNSEVESNGIESKFSYGLYTSGGTLIEKTNGTEEEAVKVAIDRLQPQFNNLLAAKWLELSNNEFSSALKVGAVLTAKTEEKFSSLQKNTFSFDQTQLASKKLPFDRNRPSPDSNSTVPVLIKGSDVQLTLNNSGEQSLYVLILGVDSDSNIFALYTPSASQPAEAAVQLKDIEISPSSQLAFPSEDSSWKWKVSDSVGINNIYAILSVQPFAKTLITLAAEQNFKLDQQQFLNVVNPISVMHSVMEDLHRASAVPAKFLENENAYALDVKSWTTLNFVYEIARG